MTAWKPTGPDVTARRLGREEGKPLDFGNGRIVGSVTADGRIAALGACRGAHGVVFLEGADAFPDESRFDARAVRAFRARLADRAAPGLGLAPQGDWRVEWVEVDDQATPRACLSAPEGLATVTTWAPVEGCAAGQLWRWHSAPATLEWGGPAHLRRAAMTQLTEGGVQPSPDAETRVSAEDGGLCLHAPELETAVWIDGLPDPAACRWRDGRLSVPVELDEGGELSLRFGMGRDPGHARTQARSLATASLAERAERARAFLDPLRAGDLPEAVGAEALPLLERAAWYALDCCRLEVGDAGDTTCIVTDHRILPLCWTRDAYYVATALTVGAPVAGDVVGRYLRWLFEVAERPQGAWARSYLPSGQVKDPAFQLDQQCYPWLQLAEHATSSGEAALLDRYLPRLDATLGQLERRRCSGAALFASDETPADDPLAYPYHTSSHVLLWHTLERLGAVAGRADLRALAAEVRAAVLRHLTVRHADARLFAYAADLDGGADLYHDANDLPMALAPLWGFCPSTDATWRSTMAFAFSGDNPGYAAGPLGGLGSRHTPGAWPLGDVQELLWSVLVGRPERARQVTARLAATAMSDGALPEARDPDDGSVISRHWFGWPGAALLLAARRWIPAPRRGA